MKVKLYRELLYTLPTEDKWLLVAQFNCLADALNTGELLTHKLMRRHRVQDSAGKCWDAQLKGKNKSYASAFMSS